MGYYTTFNFVNIEGEFAERFHDDFELGVVTCEYGALKDEVFVDGLYDSMNTKWYQWQDDLKRWSEEYPNTYFELHGFGEDADGDIWRAYARNGRIEVAHAQYTFAPPTATLVDSVVPIIEHDIEDLPDDFPEEVFSDA